MQSISISQQGVARWTKEERTLSCSGWRAKHRLQPIILRTKLRQVEMRWLLNPEQFWAKAAECWDAARQARCLDQRRLYDQIADAQQSRAVLAAR